MYIKRWSFGGARDELRPRMVGAAAATTSPPLDWSKSSHSMHPRHAWRSSHSFSLGNMRNAQEVQDYNL